MTLVCFQMFPSYFNPNDDIDWHIYLFSPAFNIYLIVINLMQVFVNQ